MTRAGPKPRESASRCALQSQLRGDRMLGTAPPARRLLLVEQEGPWGRRGFTESRADPELARRVDDLAADAGMRLQLVRRPGRHAATPGGVRRVAVADVVERATWWWQTPDLDTLVDELGDRTEHGRFAVPVDAVRDPAPLLLVCTHGKHDACCALRGRPVVRELAALRPGQVWETSHVGGDRFAANVLVLPTGELYGRVLPFAAADLLERVDRGEVVPGLMRGRLGLPPIAQAALVFAHERLVLTHRDDLTVQHVGPVEDGVAEVLLARASGLVRVTVAVEWSDPNKLTCHGAAQARVRVYRGLAVTEP